MSSVDQDLLVGHILNEMKIQLFVLCSNTITNFKTTKAKIDECLDQLSYVDFTNLTNKRYHDLLKINQLATALLGLVNERIALEGQLTSHTRNDRQKDNFRVSNVTMISRNKRRRYTERQKVLLRAWHREIGHKVYIPKSELDPIADMTGLTVPQVVEHKKDRWEVSERSIKIVETRVKISMVLDLYRLTVNNKTGLFRIVSIINPYSPTFIRQLQEGKIKIEWNDRDFNFRPNRRIRSATTTLGRTQRS